MEVMVFAKQMAEIGVTPTAVIALAIAWQISKSFNAIDKRLAIVESKVGVK